YTAHNPSIDIIRHAVSIDERRWFFRQNLMGLAEEQGRHQDLKQHWFPGVHDDVGGGYPESDGGLWRVTFEWILREARAARLQINEERLHAVLNRTPPPARPWLEPKHESLTPLWWPAEFVPKWHRAAGSDIPIPRIGMGRHRTIPNGALMDRSTLLRVRESDY